MPCVTHYEFQTNSLSLLYCIFPYIIFIDSYVQKINLSPEKGNYCKLLMSLPSFMYNITQFKAISFQNYGNCFIVIIMCFIIRDKNMQLLFEDAIETTMSRSTTVTMTDAFVSTSFIFCGSQKID